MSSDPIIEEVRAARDAYAKQFGYDLNAIARDLKVQESKSGRKVVRFPARRVEPATATAAPQKNG